MNEPKVIDATKPFDPYELVDELIYRSYRYNRLRSPDIKPESWGNVFANVDKLEAKFQAETTRNSRR